MSKAKTGAKTKAESSVAESESAPDFSNVTFQSWGTFFSFIAGHEPTKENIQFFINQSYFEL
jgi:hypothetical protein